MTIDEAIQHCLEKGNNYNKCGKEHLQLARWLSERKVLKKTLEDLMPIIDRNTYAWVYEILEELSN